MQTEKLIQMLEKEDTYSNLCEKEEAGICAIVKFIFTYAIISNCSPTGYEDRWCYHSYEKAKEALDLWNGYGEPTGWHRHPNTGRRVKEDGTIEINF